MAETKKNNNLQLWDSVEKTDPKFTKKVAFGRGFTSVDAMYQIKQATDKFGRYGHKWGIRDISIDYVDAKEQKLAVLTAIFFSPEGEVSTSNSVFVVDAKGRVDEEFSKKLLTNTITKELSRLGFSADVFLGKFDDDRYVREMEQEFSPKRDWQDELRQASLGGVEELRKVYGSFPKDKRDEYKEMATKLSEEIKED